jgi:uncharacterized protein (TIGR00369 family)
MAEDETRFVERNGMYIVRDGADAPAMCVDVSERHRQVNGVVHGSVLHMLLDTAMGAQCFRANGRKPVATAEISVRYLVPVFAGTLEARARIIKAGKRVLTVEGWVRRDGEVVAVGQATFVPIAKDPGKDEASASGSGAD